MITLLANKLNDYLNQNSIDMFSQSSFEQTDFFECDQILSCDENSIVQTIILINEQIVSIEYVLICEKLMPETRWAMLEFFNVLNSDATAFSTILSPIDSEDECDEIIFRYHEPAKAIQDVQQILFTYNFMAEYINDVLYPEISSILGTELSLAETIPVKNERMI